MFSDETLETFEKYDRESYRAITANFAYWDDIEIHFKGTVHRIGGNGFCGCSRAHPADAAAGARPRARRRAAVPDRDPIRRPHRDADLIVAADGINSRVRETHANAFQPSVDLRPNKFAWMGSTRPFDAFTFFFRETEHGIFIAHCYQYEPGRSTWVMETDPETFARAGLDKLTRQQSAQFLEGVFAEELGGHKLHHQPLALAQLSRRSATSAGRTDNIVLIGDAKATAHFSIGSGTKLAMEDAIALFERSARPADATSTKRARALRDRAARRGREDAARRRRLAGLVRACATASGTWTRRASRSA